MAADVSAPDASATAETLDVRNDEISSSVPLAQP